MVARALPRQPVALCGTVKKEPLPAGAEYNGVDAVVTRVSGRASAGARRGCRWPAS